MLTLLWKLVQLTLIHVRAKIPVISDAMADKNDLAVLGIGERVGITPLGGLIACLYAANPEYVKSKYNLPMLREIENLVAEAVEVNIPFMNPITFVPSFPFPFFQNGLKLFCFPQWILRIHTQGWHSCQGYPQQPEHV